MLRFHALEIVDIRPEAEDAVAIALDVPEALQPEFQFHAGQHIVLRAELDGVEQRRTYSIVNAPGEWPLRIGVRIHEKGKMSRFLSGQLRAGDRIDVLPPNGSFTPRRIDTERGGHYVAFASGCGITPILSIVRTVLATDPRARFTVFYGNRSTARMMFLEDLLALKDRYVERLALHFVMSREPQEVDLYNGRIDAARTRELIRLIAAPTAVTEYFLSGPGSMIDEVSSVLRELDIDGARIHSEHFTVSEQTAEPQTVAAPARQIQEPQPAASDMCEVTVNMDGRRRVFTMRMNDETVLDAAAMAGLELPYSCRAGVCSTCRTKVVNGKVEMAQNYALEEWEVEQGYVLACQSRVLTPQLELDYDER